MPKRSSFCSAYSRHCERTSHDAQIFFASPTQERVARAYMAQLTEAGVFRAPIVTRLEPLDAFYPAEDYHQDYYRKEALRYRIYRQQCGRDERLRQLYGAAAGGE